MTAAGFTGAGFDLDRKVWDSEFFARDIYSLHLSGDLQLAPLSAALLELDAAGVWGVECTLDSARFGQAPILEDIGFRLVDSRMIFVSEMTLHDISKQDVPYGVLRTFEPRDIDWVRQLTIANLVDNSSFHSRYKDRRLFTRDESIRYYNAWNELAYRDSPHLFAVWAIEDEVAAYFTYVQAGFERELPVFKGGLTAVDPRHRGHGVQNKLQAYLFTRMGAQRWIIDNTTQMTNTAVLTNHMRALKKYRGSALTFYRVTGDRDRSPWTGVA